MARSASSRPRSASIARARANPATVLLTIAAITNAASATQFSSSAMVKRCSGGIWKKLKATALVRDATKPIPSPHTVETRRIAGI